MRIVFSTGTLIRLTFWLVAIAFVVGVSLARPELP